MCCSDSEIVRLLVELRHGDGPRQYVKPPLVVSCMAPLAGGFFAPELDTPVRTPLGRPTDTPHA